VIECFVGRNHLAGAWVSVTVVMARKSPLVLVFGPADAAGLLRVARAQLLETAQQERSLFPSVYGSPTQDWTGRLKVEILNGPAIARAVQNYRSFRGIAKYPAEYESRLLAFASALKKFPAELLSVKAAAVPVGSATIETFLQRAGP
jgi:hypothetical protein